MAHPATAAFEHHLLGYRRVWRGSLFSSFVLPVVSLLAIGVGVGGFVDDTSALGSDYFTYLAPGLLATTVMMTSVFESIWPVYSAIAWTRLYHAMLASPLRIGDIMAGHIVFVLFRAVLSGSAFLLVMIAFGAVHSVLAVACLPVLALLGLAIAAPTFAFTASVPNERSFPLLFRFVVVPAQLLSGVFFPVSQLPVPIRPVAWVSPLWHGVELCRGATLGHLGAGMVLLHLTVLAGWAVVGCLLARMAFRRRLED